MVMSLIGLCSFCIKPLALIWLNREPITSAVLSLMNAWLCWAACGPETRLHFIHTKSKQSFRNYRCYLMGHVEVRVIIRDGSDCNPRHQDFLMVGNIFLSCFVNQVQKRPKASLSEGQRLVGRHKGFTQLTSVPSCISMVACLLGNNLDRNKVFLMSLGSRKRQMDGEPATCCSPQQGQQPAAGERVDGVGGGGQRPARQETVGGAAPAHLLQVSQLHLWAAG